MTASNRKKVTLVCDFISPYLLDSTGSLEQLVRLLPCVDWESIYIMQTIHVNFFGTLWLTASQRCHSGRRRDIFLGLICKLWRSMKKDKPTLLQVCASLIPVTFLGQFMTISVLHLSCARGIQKSQSARAWNLCGQTMAIKVVFLFTAYILSQGWALWVTRAEQVYWRKTTINLL